MTNNLAAMNIVGQQNDFHGFKISSQPLNGRAQWYCCTLVFLQRLAQKYGEDCQREFPGYDDQQRDGNWLVFSLHASKQ